MAPASSPTNSEHLEWKGGNRPRKETKKKRGGTLGKRSGVRHPTVV
jgi:hypothetical protein